MKNILTIDVEEIFHAELVRNSINLKKDFRTPQNIPIVLDLLSAYNAKATFFIVGEIAQLYPQIVKEIENYGHEVAFHSWSHLPLQRQNRNSFKEEIFKFKEICPKCVGFRAPSFSLNKSTSWALDVLLENNFQYDSSIFPAYTPMYGSSKALMRPYTPSSTDISKETPGFGLREFPLAVYSFLGLRVPIAGGFWLRFWSNHLIKKGIKKLNAAGMPAVLFLHNWELDPETPKIRLPLLKNFVTYHHFSKTKEKLVSLMTDNALTSVKDYINSSDFLGTFD
ncbi:MAG: polysaccharide deacetylase family protein [Candidatus Bathyarchaeia archaeon]|jgi:polysaccharide deacetylase family protein (PEP-CTERM system associated)